MNTKHKIFLNLLFILFMLAGCRNEKNLTFDKNESTLPQTTILIQNDNSQFLSTCIPSDEEPEIQIEQIKIQSDKDNDGVDDLEDFIQGARIQVYKQPRYVSDYYKGGYPPDDIAVCTDIVWRAFENAGYDLKTMVDKDIEKNVSKYTRVGGKPDPNIDFRRVRNLIVFFKNHGKTLTKEIKPFDAENLKQWQGGDLVTFCWGSIDHIAIVSDKRAKNGVPYLIHTYGTIPKEDDRLIDWSDSITYHFRYPRIDEK